MENRIRVWIPNTFQKRLNHLKEEGRGKKEETAFGAASLFLLPSSVFVAFVFALSLAGCGPKYTYPSEKVNESIEKICKDEYKLDVTARVAGKTAGALFVLDSLFDDNEQIAKEVYEQMSRVMMAVTRVALSSDRPIDFCKVVIRDKERTSELIVVRSIEDARRAQGDAIGIEESMNRTLFSQEKVAPSIEGEDDFTLKEVKMEDFLADQIAQRLRFDIMKSMDKEDLAAESGQPLVLVDGSFDTAYGKRSFRFSILSLKADRSDTLMRRVFRMATAVLQGYKFTDYDDLEIQDYLNRRRLIVERDVVLQFLAKKVSEDEIVEQFVTEAPAIHEAFKLFGIDLPDTNTPDGQSRRAAAPTV